MSSPTQSDSIHHDPQNLTAIPETESHNAESQSLKTQEAEASPAEIERSDDVSENLSANETEDSPPVKSSSVASVYRRGTKRKKWGAQKRRVVQKSMKNLEVLSETLKPIPFVPSKSLDFAGHEKLLKRLGLWDFVHVEFDRVIQTDLLAQLIASFNPSKRCSHVKEVRVMVNRADLARALKLPVKKLAREEEEDDDEVVATEESISFIEDFVSNWLLLHDDIWMMPNEVLNWMKLIKEGNFEKVDWASIIWFMIEKELAMAPNLTECYYASHLQCLIKSQKEELFPPKEEAVIVEVEEESSDVKEEPVVAEQDEEEPKVDDVGKSRIDTVDVSGDLTLSVINSSEDVKVAAIDANEDVRMGGADANAIDANEHVRTGEADTNAIDANEHVRTGEADTEAIDANEDVRTGEADTNAIDANEDVRTGEADTNLDSEEHNTKLSLGGHDNADLEDNVELCLGGQDVNAAEKTDEDVGQEETEQVGEESLMDHEECKEKEDDSEPQWLLGKNSLSSDNMLLRQCSFGVEVNRDLCLGNETKHEEDEEDEEEHGTRQEEEEEDEEDVDEDQGGFDLSPKGLSLDGFPSANLIQSMETSQMNLGPGISGEFFSSRNDAQMPPLFGNGGSSKREMSFENDNSHHIFNSNKRLRIGPTYDNNEKMPGDVYTLVNKIQNDLEKVKMEYAAKEQTSQESAMNYQMAMHELDQRAAYITHIQKLRNEEQQKTQVDFYAMEKELNLLTHLLDGYRKALKETQRAFAEYRAQNPKAEEPLYKDVPGSNGLVLSVTEIEKLRLKQEEEDRATRLAIEQEVTSLESWWDCKFADLGENVDVLNKKLASVEREMELVKELHAARKVSATPEPEPEPAQAES